MAVHKRSYKTYQGAYTPAWSRFLVIPRHAWANLFQYRFLLIFYALCFFYPVGCAVVIYLNSNLDFLRQYVPLPQGSFFTVGGQFFLVFTNFQGALAFLLAAFVGPGLVSPDLVNGGLPLYFYRPFSRTEYLAGKMMVLVGLLSTITWIPGLLLWAIQAGVSDGWASENYWLAGSIVTTSMVWILLISLLALALSAWVRWRIVAGSLMLVVFFLCSGLAQAINAAMRTELGYWIDPIVNIEMVTTSLFRLTLPDWASVDQSVTALALMCVFCLWLLTRKVRAFEVVK